MLVESIYMNQQSIWIKIQPSIDCNDSPVKHSNGYDYSPKITRGSSTNYNRDLISMIQMFSVLSASCYELLNQRRMMSQDDSSGGLKSKMTRENKHDIDSKIDCNADKIKHIQLFKAVECVISSAISWFVVDVACDDLLNLLKIWLIIFMYVLNVLSAICVGK